MTLPVSGPISFADINTEIYGSTSSAQVSLNDSVVRSIFTVPSGQIDMNMGHDKAYTIPGNSGVITGGGSYTLPRTSGKTVNVLAIAGGGGGGGGSGRTYWSGFTVGAGGGGSGGAAYATNVSVTPGQSVSFSIGGAGGGGASRDGNYGSGGSDGGAGATTTIYVNGNPIAQAYGGSGGMKAYQNQPEVPATYGGAGGGVSIGSNALGSTNGLDGQDSVYTEGGGRGGQGARGFIISTGQTSIGNIIGYGGYGSEGENQAGGTGSVYGAGGTGGGTVQSDRHYAVRINSAGGSGGAVYIWWY